MLAKPFVKTPFGPQQAAIDFAKPGKSSEFNPWQVPSGHSRPNSARDAVEFAELAGKRWRYYSSRGEAATSVKDIESRISEDRQAEIGFLLIARPDWADAPSDALGIAWCRRTWCHHLVLDFLSVHPAVSDKLTGYGGFGVAMLYAIALVTKQLQIPLIWGEATSESAPYYQKLLEKGSIQDHFFIRGRLLRRFQKEGASADGQP